MSSGDLSGALELLKQSKTFAAGLVPAVDDAQKKLGSLESALANLKDTATAFAQDEAEPALQCLLAYAAVLKKTIDKPVKSALQATLDSKSAKDWAVALAHCERVKNRTKPAEKQQQAAQELLA